MNVFKNKKLFILILAFALIITAVGISFGAELFNDEELVQNSELIYYLDVYYDGVDKDGVKSSDTVIADINSGIMYVEDKMPEDLTFTGFVTTSNGSIGAVTRTGNNSCVGSVIDDTNEETVDTGTWNEGNTEYYYHGLHYDAETRTVSFRVKNLKAGCKLTVGIKTVIANYIDNPNTADIEEKRIDIYNYATVSEDAVTVISNVLHGYMGKNGVTTYSVTYEYSGNVPEGAPTLPAAVTYAYGSNVGVATPVNIIGYTFSGWTTSDVEVSDGKFIMPKHNVTFTGSYSRVNTKYKVKYIIEGITPSGYVVPTEKEYYVNSSVSLDMLSKSDIFNGYVFSGWETSDITLANGDKTFAMPEHDVTFTGSFTEKKYRVTYEFMNTVKPDNANELLPESVEYSLGETVSLADVSDIEGYHFLGWYKENNFTMPDEDITIYGEWIRQNGTFEPTINLEIEDPKDVYRGDDVIKYIITVKNTAEFEIHDVIIKENNEGTKFVEGEGYTIQSPHFAKIDTILPDEEVVLYAEYKVLKNDSNKLYNEVELVGALADNYQILKQANYKKSVGFDVMSNLIVHHYVKNTTTEVHEDEVSEVFFGSTYTTNPIDSSLLNDGYRNKYSVVDNTNNTSGIIDKNTVEVTYYYALEMYNISVSVVGGVGNITGNETVIGGSDSTQDIIIKPSNGYIINKILVNGIEVEITDEKEMTLDKFVNVRENKNIEVEFKEENQPVPITGISIKIYMIVNILMFIAFIMYCLYRKFTSKKAGGEM